MNQQLTTEHLETILDFRFEMMKENGTAHVLADDWRDLTAVVYAGMYGAGTGAHFGAVVDGRIVATAGCMIKDDFPAPTLKARRYGWIMDVYVLPEYRNQGLAKQLTNLVLEWFDGKDIKVIKLRASAQARDLKLYHKLGFTETNEMILRKPSA